MSKQPLDPHWKLPFHCNLKWQPCSVSLTSLPSGIWRRCLFLHRWVHLGWQSHTTRELLLGTLMLFATIVSYHRHSIFFMKWWQLLWSQIILISLFCFVCLYSSASPQWFYHQFLTAQMFLFSVFHWTKYQQVTTHVSLVPFRNLAMLITDQSLTQQSFSVGTLLFWHHFPPTH